MTTQFGGRTGSDALMARFTTTNPPLSTTAATAGQLVVGPRGQLEPPFSRHIVDSKKVVDGGRYGRWAIGHGQGMPYWDRSTPQSSRPPSSSRAHEELVTHNYDKLGKFLPGGVPHETTFERIWARDEPPRYTTEVSKRSPLINTSMGVVGR
mmetsp:Transcript_104410/g.185666  ORF Transcript_104410/g.185666 Transcript_104410/m.185666 type:complete len:152 (-) Transcript_104410:82-537(-)|eukprot:CAMPEP_0197687266 /NCGR_PEP_ID=MMETSP1338-20131121/103738_1 /TAXON_ID=43686 ORGANISM="Pelagodinium beii, Strain RCC1491" /NCGR_SAMPLE_ID=MMETSP1338 /ASSEMBLY_ACC=CAM_ASM_000754 /LENGTH=151 /DNA_ID=CAMNT_0043269343 /DNA_START=93 /DNA_END=548 /DNA_ORIENTATION=-